MSRIDPEIMLRIRAALMAELPVAGSHVLLPDLRDRVGRKLQASGVPHLSKQRMASAIKYLRDRKQIAAVRMAGNQVGYYKTGNAMRRMSNRSRREKSADLILPTVKLSPMEFTVHLLAQSQFSEGRHELF